MGAVGQGVTGTGWISSSRSDDGCVIFKYFSSSFWRGEGRGYNENIVKKSLLVRETLKGA